MRQFIIVRLLSISYLKTHFEKVLATFSQEMTYEALLDKLRTEKLLFPNHFPAAMQQQGHIVFDFVVDTPRLLQFWDHSSSPCLLRALKTFAIQKKADVLYFERAALSYISPAMKQELLQTVPSLKLLTGYWGAQISQDLNSEIFQHIHLLFTSNDHLGKQLAKYVPHVVVKGCWYDGKEENFIPFDKKKITSAFIGSTGFGYEDHTERFKFLSTLCAISDVKIWGDEPKLPKKAQVFWALVFLNQICPTQILRHLEQQMPIRKARNLFKMALKIKTKQCPYPLHFYQKPLIAQFPKRIQPPKFGLEYEQLIRDTQIIVNYHANDPALFGNMRCFEVTGLGSLLLTDRGHEMRYLFEPDKEVISFTTVEEAVEKLCFLKNHPQQAEAIARCGQQRTLQSHTIYKKIGMVCEHIGKHATDICRC